MKVEKNPTQRQSEPARLPDHVLVVEDSMIIALDTEDRLRDLGVGKVTLESTSGGALALLAKDQPDLALLDFNLGTESSEQVAEELARRGVPFWLATGYADLESRGEELGAAGMLTKPYGERELVAVLEEFSRSREAAPQSGSARRA